MTTDGEPENEIDELFPEYLRLHGEVQAALNHDKPGDEIDAISDLEWDIADRIVAAPARTMLHLAKKIVADTHNGNCPVSDGLLAEIHALARVEMDSLAA